MSPVSRLSLHCLESFQQLFVKLPHNQRIVSKQAKARRYDVFIVAFSQLTGEAEIPREMFCPRPGNRRCLAGARRARAGAGAAPALTRGRRMPKNHRLLGGQGCHHTCAPHLQCHRFQTGRDSWENTRKRGDGAGAVLCPLSGWSWVLAKIELCSGQEGWVWEDDPSTYY